MKDLQAPEIFENAETLGTHVAAMLMDEYQKNKKLVVGFPWGTTPIPIFDAFAKLVKMHDTDLSNLHLVSMDEYVVGRENSFNYPEENAPYSGHSHIKRDLLEKLPQTQAKILGSNIHFPDPMNPETFDEQIAEMGGVDYFIVAVGAHDGHVAMRGSGTNLSSRTSLISIPESVRDYNFEKLHSYFDEDKGKVPYQGISIGLRTILDSKKLLFVAHGPEKAGIVRKLYDAKKFDKSLPITFLWEAADITTVLVDRTAWSQ